MSPINFARLAVLFLIGCSGDPGAAGPAGPQGEPGATGPSGPSGASGSSPDGGSTSSRVVWVDADGKEIPAVSTELGGFEDLSMIPFFDSNGIIWNLRADGVVGYVKQARRFFVGSTCSGTAYTFGIQPVVSFGYPGGKQVFAYPSNVSIRTVSGIESYKEYESDT